MFAFSGVGVYPAPEVAREAFGIEYETYLPSPQAEIYQHFSTIA
jgi:hypothetical protein